VLVVVFFFLPVVTMHVVWYLALYVEDTHSLDLIVTRTLYLDYIIRWIHWIPDASLTPRTIRK